MLQRQGFAAVASLAFSGLVWASASEGLTYGKDP